jgi:Zn-dependent peptidase ImmA (M78 family)
LQRSEYYEQMKTLAREIRTKFGLKTPRVLRTHLRSIYKDYGIKIDLWPIRDKLPSKFRKLRGAYFNDEIGPTVMINRKLPEDPRVFTMAHELKHHLVDNSLSLSYCGQENETQLVEISAEVFAAELIYPEMDFFSDLTQIGVRAGSCQAADLVRLKHESQTTLSYAGLAKRAVFFQFAPKGSFDKVQWQKIEASIYGIPFYKRRS